MQSNKLSNYIDSLQSRGRYTFTLNDVRHALNRSDSAIKAALFRVVKKGLAVAVRKGFYVIVPPEYRVRGIIPPVLFIDDLMRYLGRNYYVGLLSAAALHGAAHQQPQDFFIVTSVPALRTISAKAVKIHFLSKRNMPVKGIEAKKTDTGSIKISTPELTAIDLVLFEKQVGGLNRAAEVLAELVDLINIEAIGEMAKTACPLSVVQRLGYLFEGEIKCGPVAESLFKVLQKRPFYPVPLTTGKPLSQTDEHNRWKVQVNSVLDIDA